MVEFEKSFPIRFLFLLPILTLLLATGRAEDHWTVRHSARAMQPGEVVLFELQPAASVDSIYAHVFDRSFPCYPESGADRWLCLVGIDLEASPGRYTARFSEASSGSEVGASSEFTVEEKEFPVRRLTVDEKFVNPPSDELERIRRESALVREIFAGVTPERFWRGAFTRPVPGAASSSFGKRSILNGQPRSPHTGTDFSAAQGTPIHAPNRGRVVLAQDLYFAGQTVILDHGGGLYSYFAHLSKFDVEEGEWVEKNEVVGEVGSTGRVTGAHLHWTLRLAETRVDPLSLMEISREIRE